MQPSNTGIEKKIMSDKELEELTSERKQTRHQTMIHK
jgi:hypothetical protein